MRKTAQAIFFTQNAFAIHIIHIKLHYMSHLMRKPTICICENKGVDQLRSNCEADQRLCFRYSASAIILFYLNPKFQASSSFLRLYRPVCVGPVQKPHCWFSHETAQLWVKYDTNTQPSHTPSMETYASPLSLQAIIWCQVLSLYRQPSSFVGETKDSHPTYTACKGRRKI